MDPRETTLPRGKLLMPGDDPVIRDAVNLCPFGCPFNRINEHGYCRHLVGFTIDREVVELRERFGNRERVGELIRLLDVANGDVVVATTPERKRANGQPCPTPTLRVYRKDGKAPIPDKGDKTKYENRVRQLDPSWGPEDEEDDEEATTKAAATV